jgi:hypothetical protein
MNIKHQFNDIESYTYFQREFIKNTTVLKGIRIKRLFKIK